MINVQLDEHGRGWPASPKVTPDRDDINAVLRARLDALQYFVKPPMQYTVKESNPKDIIGTRKAPMSTVSAAVMAEVGLGMLEGAAKYGRHNYRVVGIKASVYYDATMRHILSWWEGQDIDADSGLNHVTKAICSLVVLRDAMINGKMSDDRPPPVGEFYTELNKKAAAILDKYSDRNPQHYTHEQMVR